MNDAATWSPGARSRTPGPISTHHPGALVSADHREGAGQAGLNPQLLREDEVAGDEMLLGVAQSRCLPLDEDLAGRRWGDLDLFD